MILNRVEYAMMNNPVRAWVQRWLEAPTLLAIAGAMDGGRALEIGCGRGIGIELILETFGAESVDAFDLDPRMASLARTRHRGNRSRVRVWVGDTTSICTPDSTYDAVFDFGIIHHVPHWRRALAEVHRVLKPGGCLYCEEILKAFICHPVIRRFLKHPEDGRFDASEFAHGLEESGLEPVARKEYWGSIAWFKARKRTRSAGPLQSCRSRRNPAEE